MFVTKNSTPINQKIKLALLVNNLGNGGAEKVVLDIASNLDPRIFKIYVIYWNKRLNSANFKSKINDFKHIPGITIIKLKHNVRHGANIVKEFISFINIQVELIHLYKKYKWDILHSHLEREDFHASMLKRLFPQLITISTKHNTDPFRTKLPWRVLFGFFDRKMDKIIACSNYVKLYFAQNEFLPLNKIQTIFNGIDLAAIHNARQKNYEFLPSNAFKIIAVGRLDEQKGYPHLIAGFEQFHFQVPNSILIIRGDGNLQSSIQQLIDTKNLQKHILILKRRLDLFDLMKSCDVFALLSNWEGFSIAFIEAMAIGLPVIASDIESMKEEVINDVNGFLVDRFNSKAINDKLFALYQNPQLCKKMGDNGRRIVQKKFLIQTMINKYERIYTDLFNSITKNKNQSRIQ